MPREVLKLLVDVPLTVTLDRGPEGVETEGKAGKVDYQYTVNRDACVMWLPPAAREALLRSGARPGETVQIVKSLRGNQATYNVQRIGAQEPLFPSPQAFSAAAVKPSEPYPPLAPPPPPAPPQPPAPPARAPRPWSMASSQSDPLEDLAAACLEASARANWRAYTTARNEGIEIDKPAWADVRATAVSIFIARSGARK